VPKLVVVMDLDDTLTDRASTFDKWCAAFLTRHQAPAGASEILTRLDRRGLCPRPEFLRRASLELDLDLDLDLELKRYRAQTAAPPAMRGVRSRLKMIRRDGGVIVVLSNGVFEVQRMKLANADLLPLVDDVLISDAMGVAKPAPEAFALAVHHSHKILPHPDAVWMVGDSIENDIKGALDFGLHAAWVNRAGIVWDGSPRPHVTESSTAACLDHVFEWLIS
jgi:putative hydrolase of the HAD superfamily